MRHKKIFKRVDGSKNEIEIEFYNDSYKTEYRVNVRVCKPKKRTFENVNNTDDYRWRRLNFKEKAEYEMKNNLEYVTMDEIQETALELWDKMKPDFLNNKSKYNETL